MFRLLVALTVVASASAFSPVARSAISALRMSSAESLPGAIGPLNFFDPLNLSAGKSDITIKRWRESEIKHGRLAMLGALGILVGEGVEFNTPLFGDKIVGPAIYQFQETDDVIGYGFAAFIVGIIAVIEFYGIDYAWETVKDKALRDPKGKTQSQLKPNHLPGDLAFDPLGLKPSDEEAFATLQAKELSNGRLAMIGAAGMIVQELINGKGILENLGLEQALPAAFDTKPF